MFCWWLLACVWHFDMPMCRGFGRGGMGLLYGGFVGLAFAGWFNLLRWTVEVDDTTFGFSALSTYRGC